MPLIIATVSSHKPTDTLLYKHVDIATSKLQAKQKELKAKEAERDAAKSALENLCALPTKDNVISSQMHELGQLRSDFVSQSKAYQQAQTEVDEMEAVNANLNETEQQLQKELSDIEALLKGQEELAGVAGFHFIRAELEQTGKNTSKADEDKSQTLADISETVTKIATMLEAKRKELEPKVQELKRSRTQFQEFQQRFSEEKTAYTSLVQKAKADNESLEQESARLELELQEKEEKYMELCSSNETLETNFQCCQSTDVNDLEIKATEQSKSLIELRKRHAALKDNESYNDRQQILFSKLVQLLELKAKSLESTCL